MGSLVSEDIHWLNSLSLEWKGDLYCYTCKPIAGYQCAIQVCIDFLKSNRNTLKKWLLFLELYGVHMTDLLHWFITIAKYTCVRRSTLCAKCKNIVSKRDSSVKCSIELFEIFVYILPYSVMYYYDRDLFESMKNKGKTPNLISVVCDKHLQVVKCNKY